MGASGTALLFGLGVLLIAPIARAQEPGDPTADVPSERTRPTGDREYHGLFGSRHQRGSRGQFLDLRLSVYDSYDTLVPLGIGATTTTVSRTKRGTYPGANATFGYEANGGKMLFEAASSTGTRLYPDLNNRTLTTESATAALVVNFSKSLVLAGYGSYGYRPLFSFAPGIGVYADGGTAQTSIEPLDVAVANSSGYIAATQVSLTETIHKWAFSGHYGFHTSHFDSNALDLRVQETGGELRRNLTRYAAVHAGYTYHRPLDTAFLVSQVPRVHDLDLGLEYMRPLSFSRNTMISAEVGSSVIQSYHAPTIGPTTYSAMQFVGKAGLRHQFGRSWSADLQYRRGLDYLEGFHEPLFATSALASVGGYVNRRLSLSGFLTYSMADRTAAVGRAFDTGSATASLRFALNQHLSAYSEYVYFRYNFTSGSPVLASYRSVVNHHVVRVGATVWMPIIGH